MLAKAWNDFSTPTRKHSCRSSSCANECLRCASVNRPFVLNCRRSLTRPTIGQPSCDWRRLSRRSSHACAVPLRRLMSRSASESSGSWSKTSWWGTTPSPFVTASQSHRVPHKTAVRRQVGQMIKVTFCVRGVISPTLSNILLTPFDREMRLRGYQLTRYADDWVITCKSAAEARAAVEAAGRILKQLGVELHPQKTRIVHVREGFEFLGYKIKRGQRKLHLPASKIRSQARQGALYAYPKAKSIGRFMDQVRQRTKRTISLNTPDLIAELNPLLRGWGEYYKRAHVRKLFQRLDGWIRRRIWSHRYRRWRNVGWKRLPVPKLYGEYELVRLIDLLASLASRRR